jgi:PIN domain nuclease of toxin-antitoxin system
LKVRAGKWPEIAIVADDLLGYLGRQKGCVADLEPAICLAAGRLDWAHRDPFDRMLAATARHYAMPLISADTVFDGIVQRIW